MGAHDCPEEGPEDFGSLPDPTQRTWRHPSEIAAANAQARRYEAEEAVAAAKIPATRVLTPQRLAGTLVVGAMVAGMLVLQFRESGNGMDTTQPAQAGLDNSAAQSAVQQVQVSSTSTTAARVSDVPISAEITIPKGLPGGAEVGASTSLIRPHVPGVFAMFAPAETQAALRTWGQDTEDDVEEAENAVQVALNTPPSYELRTSTALGSAVSLDGFLLSSASATRGNSSVVIDIGDGDSGRQLVRANVVAVDVFADLAVLMVPDGAADTPTALITAHLHPTPDEVKPGTGINVVAGLPHRIHKGSVVDTGQRAKSPAGQDLLGLILTSAPLPKHAVGGAIVDEDRRVIGLVVHDHSYLASALPIDAAIQLARTLLLHGDATSAALGMQTDEAGRIETVHEGGPASKAGLLQGDQLREFDGTELKTQADFEEAVRKTAAGQAVDVEVERVNQDGRAESFTVTLEAAVLVGAPAGS